MNGTGRRRVSQHWCQLHGAPGSGCSGHGAGAADLQSSGAADLQGDGAADHGGSAPDEGARAADEDRYGA
jgi:hypothetical protein